MADPKSVVIVGGGPSGLWLACELRLAGIDVCVVERRTSVVAQSRSLTIHGRTLEILALRGLAGRFLEKGKPLPSWHFGGLETRLDFSAFPARYPFMLFISQSQTEALLEARAIELGVDIRRGCSVDVVRPESDIVVVGGSTGTAPFELRASYVVGADGARSVVRTQSAIAFAGMAPTQSFMMADAQVDLPPGAPGFTKIGPEGALMIVPLGDGVQHRIIRADPERADVPQQEPLTEIELAASLRRLAGTDFNLRAATWLTRFTDETRLADSYRRGRIFLVGDAAHIHAPMGGQGLNVGLQDAMNLGWKLAHVIKGQAPESLLDSYETERRPVGERLYENTLAQACLATAFSPAGAALRKVVDEFLRNPELNRQLAGELSGFDLSYPQPLLPIDALSDQQASGHAIRVPDEDLTLADGADATLYQFLEDGRWLHLSDDPATVTGLPQNLDPAAVTFIVAQPRENGSLMRYSAILIRPDGYTAAVYRR